MENFTLLQCRIFREAIPWFIRSLCALFNLIPSISMVSCYELVLYYFHSQFKKSVKAANWMLKRQGWRNLLQYILLLPISYYSYSDTKSHRIAWSVDSKSEDWQYPVAWFIFRQQIMLFEDFNQTAKRFKNTYRLY